MLALHYIDSFERYKSNKTLVYFTLQMHTQTNKNTLHLKLKRLIYTLKYFLSTQPKSHVWKMITYLGIYLKSLSVT